MEWTKMHIGGRYPRFFRVVRRWLYSGIIIYALLCLFVYFTQESIIFYPIKNWNTTPKAIGLSYEVLSITTSDGEKLSAWYLPKQEAKRVVLFAHGNGGNISHRLDSLAIFHRLGMNVLIFDYRGYGKSTGSLSEQGTYRDIDAVWKHLIEKKEFTAKQIIIFGRSLGGAVAIDLAARQSCGGLIVESSFSSAASMADRLFKYLPARFLLRYQYSSVEKISKVRCPVLVMHSTEDELIPFSEGRLLYLAAAKPKMFVTMRGDHNTGFLQYRLNYVHALQTFVARLNKK